MPDTAVAAVPRADGPLPPAPLVPGPPPGPGLTGVPALQPVFAPAALLEHVPGLFRYDLGTFGAPDGIQAGLTPPHNVALSLDGRPAEDLFTGRPAFERLPADLLSALHARPGLFGAPQGFAAYLRPYVAAVPITELRYRTGADGLQLIGVTHAQTRRPGFVQRLGGEAASMTALVHVSGDQYHGPFVNDDVNGLSVVGRLSFALPGLGLEITQRHVRRSEGAWGGVDPAAPDPFHPGAPVRDALGQREAIHNDLALSLSARWLAAAPPLRATAYWIAATHRYLAPDTTDARGHRVGLILAQRLVAGAHRLMASAELRVGAYAGGAAFDREDGPLPPEVRLSLSDSVSVGALQAVLLAGVHAQRGAAQPLARGSLGYDAPPLRLSVAGFFTAVAPSPVERLGFGGHVQAGEVVQEQVLGGEIGLSYEIGPIAFDLGAELQRRRRPRLLLIDGPAEATFVSLDGSLASALLWAGVGVRAEAQRGAYARVWVAGVRALEVLPDEIHRRAAGALPEGFGYARLGFRAPALFEGALDLEVFARARGWTPYRGRVLDPATALLGLPPASAADVPGRVVLDVVLEAGLGQGRARAFVSYQNALAGVAYPGAYVIPIYPLPAPVVRAGLFWILMN